MVTHFMFPLRKAFVRSYVRYRHKMAVNDLKYEEAVKALNELQRERMLSVAQKYEGLGLIAMREFLDRVQVTDNDIEKLKVVHVSGTKGKGSTCAFVESILRHNGITTGFFSSPHLIEVRERFRINGKPISTKLFTKYFWEVYDFLEKSEVSYEIKKPSYFYFLTVLAFYIFKHESVDAAIMEVGIGGAYDCTNVIKNPIVCGVSSLGIDHIELLGNSLESIAWQKAGIFKSSVPAFTVPQPDHSLEVLQQRAKELQTDLTVVPNFEEYSSENKKEIALGLSGEHQKVNASLAIQLASYWLCKCTGIRQDPSLSLNQACIEGLQHCQWHGRAQIIRFDSVTFYLDGAHTMRSLSCAAKWFDEASATERRELKKDCEKVLAFNITKQRDAYELLSTVLPCNFDFSVFTPNIATLIPSNFNDQNNLTFPVEDRLIRVLANRDDWLSLCASHNSVQPTPRTFVFPSIADAICLLSSDRDSKLFDRAFELTADYPDNLTTSKHKHLQVLVAGSLHLVGGYLRVLKPSLND